MVLALSHACQIHTISCRTSNVHLNVGVLICRKPCNILSRRTHMCLGCSLIVQTRLSIDLWHNCFMTSIADSRSSCKQHTCAGDSAYARFLSLDLLFLDAFKMTSSQPACKCFESALLKADQVAGPVHVLLGKHTHSLWHLIAGSWTVLSHDWLTTG